MIFLKILDDDYNIFCSNKIWHFCMLNKYFYLELITILSDSIISVVVGHDEQPMIELNRKDSRI